LTLLIMALACFIPVRGYAQPANDNFADAAVLSGPLASAAGSNVDATWEPGESVHAGAGGNRSVWWVWIAPAAGSVNIDTNGSNFDTVLAVYTGDSVSNLTQIISDDDSGDGTQSLVTFQAVTSSTYYIAVDSYSSGSSGAIQLHVHLVVPPANDNFADAEVLSGLPASANGSNVDATGEPGESVHAGVGGNRSVWWVWTAPEAGSVSIDTFGTGTLDESRLVATVRKLFDLRPKGIIAMLDLLRPIYRPTAAYGHFGRDDLDLPWERTDKVEALRDALGVKQAVA